MKLDAFLTIHDLLKLLQTNKVTANEVVEFFINRFQKYDKELGSALEIFDTASILHSQELDGVLSGIPILLKDNIAQKNRALTCGSKILHGFVSPYDATATARLKRAGVALIGRANMDEFAMGSSNEYSAYFNCANPWDITRVPGGSSGGAVAAVAAGLVPCALGSETGGSVRLPASWCNVVGLKPTYGLISRYGLVAYASSLDQIGIASRTVKDNALVLSVLAGHDICDATSLPEKLKDYTAILDGKLPSGITIGVLENMLYADGMDSEVQARIDEAIQELERMGAKIKKIKVPEIDYGAAVYFIVSRAEAASNLSRFDGVRYGYRAPGVHNLDQMYSQTRGNGFGYEQKLRTLVGNYVLSAGYASKYYHNAKKVQHLMMNAMVQAFKDVDVMIAPVHGAPAFKFGACDQNRLAMDLTDYFTCFVNLTQVPALSVPCGFTKEQLPTGFQLIGPRLSEQLLYKIGHAYEQRTPWHTMYPSQFMD